MSKEVWTAERMGRKGGKSRSEKKQRASRENGKRGGGRPKKVRAAIAKAEGVKP